LKYGICPLGIIPLRNDFNHRSEQVSQLLYGDCFKIIDQRKDWFKIRNQWDGYEGWITQNQGLEIPEEIYKNQADLEIKHATNLMEYVCLANSELVPIPLGSDLRLLDFLNHSFEGETTTIKTKEQLIKNAYAYLHTPYLWGGKSPMGIDCSGFTQMVYKLNGIVLKRDAYQQAKQGTTLSFIEESEPGDLAFFDDRDGNIIHVGILLQDHRIIHAHGKVRIDPIDQTGIFNKELQTHSHKLRMIKKII
jgi:uncharacterized protein YuzB (UPF0349 family)